MVATQESLSSLLHAFNEEQQARGSAVVTRDGLPLISALAPTVNRETFAAMIATMMGAAETAAGEVEDAPATFLSAEFRNIRIVAVGAGKDCLFVAIGPASADLDRFAKAAQALAGEIESVI